MSERWRSIVTNGEVTFPQVGERIRVRRLVPDGSLAGCTLSLGDLAPVVGRVRAVGALGVRAAEMEQGRWAVRFQVELGTTRLVDVDVTPDRLYLVERAAEPETYACRKCHRVLCICRDD